MGAQVFKFRNIKIVKRYSSIDIDNFLGIKMSSVKRIAKNTGILFVSNIISKLFGFVYTIYMARYLGAEGFGILSFDHIYQYLIKWG